MELESLQFCIIFIKNNIFALLKNKENISETIFIIILKKIGIMTYELLSSFVLSNKYIYRPETDLIIIPGQIHDLTSLVLRNSYPLLPRQLPAQIGQQ